jgi:1-deoxy-D-xylulose-5-phosphate reductoisomerase
MNGANEVAVAAFLNHKCGYLDIVRSIEYALNKAQFISKPTLDDFAAADAQSRALARDFLKLE